MKPNEPKNDQRGAPLIPQRSVANAPQTRHNRSNQEAAAEIIRSKIDNIYDTQNTNDQSAETNPYQRTHTDHTTIQAEQWKKYHTAWQNYYQKYYEGYYTHHLKLAKQQQIIDAQTQTAPIPESKSYFTHQTETQDQSTDKTKTEEVVFELRQKLLGKVQSSATKIKKSRHFLPIISGIVVVLIFLFLQYNRVLISNVMAYVSPGNIDPQNIIIDPNANISVSPVPRLIIPKINVDVPVSYDIGNDYDSQMAAMQTGVAHFAIPGANSHPGQIGNTVIAGHSSNDLFDSGDYKFIFAQLDKLTTGDTIYANYKSKRYTYTVTKKEVVSPNDVSKLVYPTTKPILTLLTCTPLGTAINRLLVIAEQISPDPTQSIAAAPAKATDVSQTSIPGNSPTFLERLFSFNWN